MRGTILIATLVLSAASIGLTPATSAGEEMRTRAYDTYVACTTGRAAPASHSCPKAHKKGAFFTSLEGDATYKICVEFPNGQRLCANRQDAPEDVKQLNPITSRQVGRHVVTWFVGGDQVGQFRFRIHR